jgi:hypothetical protein
MTITLSPRTEAMLREEAERTGQRTDALADAPPGTRPVRAVARL